MTNNSLRPCILENEHMCLEMCLSFDIYCSLSNSLEKAKCMISAKYRMCGVGLRSATSQGLVLWPNVSDLAVIKVRLEYIHLPLALLVTTLKIIYVFVDSLFQSHYRWPWKKYFFTSALKSKILLDILLRSCISLCCMWRCICYYLIFLLTTSTLLNGLDPAWNCYLYFVLVASVSTKDNVDLHFWKINQRTQMQPLSHLLCVNENLLTRGKFLTVCFSHLPTSFMNLYYSCALLYLFCLDPPPPLLLPELSLYSNMSVSIRPPATTQSRVIYFKTYPISWYVLQQKLANSDETLME